MINTQKFTKFLFAGFFLTLSHFVTFAADSSQVITTSTEPCVLLIGVETYGDCEGEPGAFVSGTINGSVAAHWGIKPGDIIIGIDQLPIDNPEDLVLAKNNYQPGDPFTLHFIRNGKLMTAEMQFPKCTVQNHNEISLVRFNVSPNPSHGWIEVNLDVQENPAQLRITTLDGQQVYHKEVPAGFLKETIQLGNTAGMYLLTLTQGDTVTTKKIVVTPLN